MALLITRRYTINATPSALNVETAVKDDASEETNFILFEPNAVLDMVNQPDPAGTYEYVLTKNGDTTPVRVFSGAISPATQGRIRTSFNMSKGKYAWKALQRTGTLAVASFLVQYAKPLN